MMIRKLMYFTYLYKYDVSLSFYSTSKNMHEGVCTQAIRIDI